MYGPRLSGVCFSVALTKEQGQLSRHFQPGAELCNSGKMLLIDRTPDMSFDTADPVLFFL